MILQGIIALLGFISTSIITNIYGISAFGEIAFALAVANVLACVVRYGFDETLIVRFHRAKSIKSEFYASLIIRYSLYFISVVALLFLPEKYSRLTFDQSLVAVSFLLIFLQLQSLFDFVGKQVIQVSTLAIGKFLLCVLLLLFSLFLGPIENYIVALFSSNLLMLLLQVHLIKSVNLPFKFNLKEIELKSTIRAQLKGNFAIMFASILSLGLYSINQIIIKEKLSFVELGVFAVLWQVINIYIVFIKQITRVYKPKLALLVNKEKRPFIKVFFKFSILVSMLPGLIAATVYPFYDQVFTTLFGNDLAGYNKIYFMMVLFLFLRGAHHSLTQWFILNQHNFAVTSSYASSLVGVFLFTAYAWNDYKLSDSVVAMQAGMLAAIFSMIIAFFNSQKELRITNSD